MRPDVPVTFLADPLDVVWLRGGRPFSSGDGSQDRGLFPPTPWTWQGMIRTAMLDRALGERLRGTPQAEVEALIGPPSRLPEGWRLLGPLPACPVAGEALDGTVEPWVRWPLLLSEVDREVPQRARLMPTADWIGPAPERLYGFRAGAKAASGGWISARNLAWALWGIGEWRVDGRTRQTKRAQGGRDLPPFVHEEPRTGLVIDRQTGTAADHLLYTAVHHRFAPGAGLWGGVVGAGTLAHGLTGGAAALGHRLRSVTLAPAALPTEAELLLSGAEWPDQALSGELFARAVLLSPAPIPEASPLESEQGVPACPFNCPPGVQVVGGQARRGPDIGGFDRIGKGGGRPSRRMWAAGSWWALRLSEAAPKVQRERLALLAATDPTHCTVDEQLGFGQRAVGLFDPQTGDPVVCTPREEPIHG